MRSGNTDRDTDRDLKIDATDRGTAIHACLALVGWLPDEMPSQEDFRAEIRASAPRRDDAWVALRLAELEGYLGRTEVAELLRKPSGSVHLGREYPIMGASDGFERRFLIDRLVIGLDKLASTEIEVDADAARAAYCNLY